MSLCDFHTVCLDVHVVGDTCLRPLVPAGVEGGTSDAAEDGSGSFCGSRKAHLSKVAAHEVF